MSEKVADQDQFQVRLPKGMRDRIKRAADQNGRSMNAEIVATLLDAYPSNAIDIGALAHFLNAMGSAAPGEKIEAYVEHINELLSLEETPFKVQRNHDGSITFVPSGVEIGGLARWPEGDLDEAE